MKSRIKYYVIPIVITIFVCFSATALACPNCKEGFEAATTQASVGEAYSFTIYMLIAMPMIIVSVIATKIIRKVREHERQQS